MASSYKGDSKMATMNISLPEQMKAWVEAQSEDGKYSNSSDFVRDLIRREKVRKEKVAHVQAQLDEGMASGYSDKSVSEILADALEEVKSEAHAA
jgi:antitoxin ParD1/3/4